MSKLISFLSLFTSFGTLICCALPALLVTLGLGAALATGISALPQLVWFSENKELVFGISGGMLLLNGVVLYLQRNATCPIDPELRDACTHGRRLSKIIFVIAVVIYGVGALFASYN